MSTCDVKNCGREIGTLGSCPAINYGDRLVCETCYKKLEEVRIELPLAITEFHAWALAPLNKTKLRLAAARVSMLRDLQERTR